MNELITNVRQHRTAAKARIWLISLCGVKAAHLVGAPLTHTALGKRDRSPLIKSLHLAAVVPMIEHTHKHTTSNVKLTGSVSNLLITFVLRTLQAAADVAYWSHDLAWRAIFVS
jgi:hypothetical protein